MLDWIVHTVDSFGYAGVFLLMLIENIIMPIPSEVIMPLAGFTAARGGMTFAGALLAGTAGTVCGMMLWFMAGRLVGAPRLCAWADRYGRWLTLSSAEIDRATRWFDRYGPIAVLVGRLVPAFNKLVSIPAGFSHMGAAHFLGLSAIGAFVWTLLLDYLGYSLGDHYELVEQYAKPLSALIFAILVLGFASWVILRKLKQGSR